MYFFFFNDTATTEIYTLSLHDALPIYLTRPKLKFVDEPVQTIKFLDDPGGGPKLKVLDDPVQTVKFLDDSGGDRKSTRLNSSHANISYAVFCLKKKKPPTYLTLLVVTS